MRVSSLNWGNSAVTDTQRLSAVEASHWAAPLGYALLLQGKFADVENLLAPAIAGLSDVIVSSFPLLPPCQLGGRHMDSPESSSCTTLV